MDVMLELWWRRMHPMPRAKKHIGTERRLLSQDTEAFAVSALRSSRDGGIG